MAEQRRTSKRKAAPVPEPKPGDDLCICGETGCPAHGLQVLGLRQLTQGFYLQMDRAKHAATRDAAMQRCFELMLVAIEKLGKEVEDLKKQKQK